MDPTAQPAAPSQSHSKQRSTYWRRLMHRWLVEYNPLYLLSAALVLAGMTVISRELALADSLYGQLGVAVIAEVYAWTLIGGAALLQRMSLRRPAVMLALLTVLYQGDLTLHTETCAYLGSVGVLASAAWLGLFLAKLEALAFALEVKLSWTARVVLAAGAVGLAALPHFFEHASPRTLTVWTTLWLFSVFAGGLWSKARIISKRALDPATRRIFRRTALAAWATWGALAVAHVLFWASEGKVAMQPLFAAGLLLSTRFVRREWIVWCCVGTALLVVAGQWPAWLSLTALMATVVLVLRARRLPVRHTTSNPPPTSEPYRTQPRPDDAAPARAYVRFETAPADALRRLYAGSAFALYLAVWTQGWTGGSWPEHGLVAVGAFTILFGFMIWRGIRMALVPVSVIHLHLGVQAGLIELPQTMLGWGASAVASGFALLAASLFVAWYLQRYRAGPEQPEA